MQVMADAGLLPSAMLVVHLHLEGAVLMSFIAEYESAVSAQHTGVSDRRHVILGRTESDRTGRRTAMCTDVIHRSTQTRLCHTS